jgi:hypothetical protein
MQIRNSKYAAFVFLIILKLQSPFVLTQILRRPDSVPGILTGLRAGQLQNRSSIPDRKDFPLSAYTSFRVYQDSYSVAIVGGD